MSYSRPNRDDPVDLLAHHLSELHNPRAPLGWEQYRYAAKNLIEKFGLTSDQVLAVLAEDQNVPTAQS